MLRLSVVMSIIAGWTATAHACSVCFGAAGDPQTDALNYAIITLLIITGVVLMSVGGFFIYLIARASGRVNSVEQPTTLPTESLGMLKEAGLE